MFPQDDSSGLIDVRVPHALFSKSVRDILQLGCCVDFVANIDISNDGTRSLTAQGCSVKEDPLADILRPLELIKLHQTVYFQGQGLAQSQSASQPSLKKAHVAAAAAAIATVAPAMEEQNREEAVTAFLSGQGASCTDVHNFLVGSQGRDIRGDISIAYVTTLLTQVCYSPLHLFPLSRCML